MDDKMKGRISDEAWFAAHDWVTDRTIRDLPINPDFARAAASRFAALHYAGHKAAQTYFSKEFRCAVDTYYADGSVDENPYDEK